MSNNFVSSKTEGQTYFPAAIYFHDSDCVEYTNEDCFAIYDRVDEYLTLIFDKTGLILIGFKLKGFKNIFTRILKPTYKLHDEQFITLVSAIEAICSTIGEEAFDNSNRKRAYQAAIKIAVNDNVKLGNISFDIAA